VVPITRSKDGGLHLRGAGKIVEWAVHMRRFDEACTFDVLAAREMITDELAERLSKAVVDSHRRATVCSSEHWVASLRMQAEETFAALAAADHTFFSVVSTVAAAVRENLHSLEPLLLSRARSSKMRRCHGDLHLRNVALVEAQPILFDAIEFDETIATCDILFDFAFLVMDLWQSGHQHTANIVLNRYLWYCDDVGSELAGLAAFPTFLALRAAIRARVALDLTSVSPGLRRESETEARRYLSAAIQFLQPQPAYLIGVGGPSGTGKSTLAAKLAPSIGRPPGAVHLRSDIERKRLFQVLPYDPLPAAAYEKETSRTVYASLRRMAAIVTSARQSVIVDAVHAGAQERNALAEVAGATQSSFAGLCLNAPLELLRQRVADRVHDASDATPDVVTRQVAEVRGDNDWHVLDASKPVAALVAEAQAVLKALPVNLAESAQRPLGDFHS
jgi:uncharacterized protein